MRHDYPMTITVMQWSAVLTALCVALIQPVHAQQLTRFLCPAGSNFTLSPNDLRPPLPVAAGDIPLLRHTIDTQIHPGAKCNDGSPAVMYIRPADAGYGGNPIVEPSSRWLVFFEGGGGCRDTDDCFQRWCGLSTKVFDRAAKMSSRGTGEAIRSPGGIFRLAAGNHFTDYNHVYVYYCSSDNGIGSAELNGISTSGGQTYDIQFQGEAVVNAVFETLLSGPTWADSSPALKHYDTPLPDLRDATEIILAGESAGGGIVRQHIDRLRETVLEPAIPGVVVRAVVSAGAPPVQSDPGVDWADPGSPASYRDMLLTTMEPTVRSFWGTNDSALDQSCLDPQFAADHDAVGSHPQVCYDTTYTLLNHITTPVFLRMDIGDPLGSERYLSWNLYPLPDYWTALYEQLQEWICPIFDH